MGTGKSELTEGDIVNINRSSGAFRHVSSAGVVSSDGVIIPFLRNTVGASRQHVSEHLFHTEWCHTVGGFLSTNN